jgi:hypothetical protein
MLVRVPSALLLMALACLGCDGQRDPPPPELLLVEIRPGHRYAFEGVAMNRRQLESALSAKAQETLRSARGGTRARVRLMLQPGADPMVRDDLVQYCLSIGLDKLETPAVR